MHLQIEPTSEPLDGVSLLRCPEVLARVAIGRTALYELVKSRRFPRPVKVHSGRRWVDAEVTRWIGERMRARETEEPLGRFANQIWSVN
jgi:prophage regulatory protein